MQPDQVAECRFIRYFANPGPVEVELPQNRDFASAEHGSRFIFAARAVGVVGVAFVVEFLQTGSGGVVTADGLHAGDLEKLVNGLPGWPPEGVSRSKSSGRGELQEFLTVHLKREVAQRGETGTGDRLWIGGFEIAHRFFSRPRRGGDAAGRGAGRQRELQAAEYNH